VSISAVGFIFALSRPSVIERKALCLLATRTQSHLQTLANSTLWMPKYFHTVSAVSNGSQPWMRTPKFWRQAIVSCTRLRARGKRPTGIHGVAMRKLLRLVFTTALRRTPGSC